MFQIVTGSFLLLCRVWDCSKMQAWKEKRPKNWKQKLSSWRLRGGGIKGGHNGIWGRGFLQTLEGSHLVFPCSSFTTSTVPCLPESQFPSFTTVSSRVHRTWSLRSHRPCHCVCLRSCHSSSWERHTGRYATSQDSTGGTKRVYQCQVEGCKEGPSTSRAAICAHVRKVHLGVGLVCPLCSKSFFNQDIFRYHKKTHQ